MSLSLRIVKFFGFPVTLIFGDTLVVDRWLWLKRHLSGSKEQKLLLDVGCGSGAFSLGAAGLGYRVTGLSWDERNQQVASDRAKACNVEKFAEFIVQDIRDLGSRQDLAGKFDMAICTEVIEHILNDEKLMKDIAGCLKPGGKLLMTAPYYHFKAITKDDDGPYSTVENGGHVRRRYTAESFGELCRKAGLTVESIDFCSGYLSQKITYILRKASVLNYLFSWIIILPLRVLPVIFDRFVSKALNYPNYSICMMAIKRQQ